MRPTPNDTLRQRRVGRTRNEIGPLEKRRWQRRFANGQLLGSLNSRPSGRYGLPGYYVFLEETLDGELRWVGDPLRHALRHEFLPFLFRQVGESEWQLYAQSAWVLQGASVLSSRIATALSVMFVGATLAAAVVVPEQWLVSFGWLATLGGIWMTRSFWRGADETREAAQEILERTSRAVLGPHRPPD